MEKELRLLLPLLADAKVKRADGIEFHIGRIGRRSVVIMQSGIGKVNAALATATMISHFAPALIVNTGVAGGTGSDARVLDVVVGDRVAYHDVWCGPGTLRGQAAGCPEYFTSDPQAVAMECLHNSPRIKHGLVCSGDIFVADPAVVAAIKRDFPEVLAVDMESAAIAHTCYKCDTPFLCLRVVSDTPGEADNIAQYENFWEVAPSLTFDIITKLLNS